MIKYILFGIGFVFLFEGLIYFFFAKKILVFVKMLENFNIQKIKSFSSFSILLGFCLIYFAFRYYEF